MRCTSHRKGKREVSHFSLKLQQLSPYWRKSHHRKIPAANEIGCSRGPRLAICKGNLQVGQNRSRTESIFFCSEFVCKQLPRAILNPYNFAPLLSLCKPNLAPVFAHEAYTTASHFFLPKKGGQQLWNHVDAAAAAVAWPGRLLKSQVANLPVQNYLFWLCHGQQQAAMLPGSFIHNWARLKLDVSANNPRTFKVDKEM